MTKTCSELFQGMDCTIIGNGNEEVARAGVPQRRGSSERHVLLHRRHRRRRALLRPGRHRPRATSLVAERKVYLADATDVTEVVVSDSRKAMAYASANYYDNPSRAFSLVGITGTNGKTTTTYLVEHIASVAGKRCGRHRHRGHQASAASWSTPSAPRRNRPTCRSCSRGCATRGCDGGGHGGELARARPATARGTPTSP